VFREKRALWDKPPGTAEVHRRGDVVPGFVPIIGQAQQRVVKKLKEGEGNQPAQEREGAGACSADCALSRPTIMPFRVVTHCGGDGAETSEISNSRFQSLTNIEEVMIRNKSKMLEIFSQLSAFCFLVSRFHFLTRLALIVRKINRGHPIKVRVARLHAGVAENGSWQQRII